MKVDPTICRCCNAFCPIDVSIEDGRATKVEGNRRAPIHKGSTCPKAGLCPACTITPSVADVAQAPTGRLVHGDLKR